MPVHCGHLVCPLWAAQSFPMGPGLGLFTKGFLLLPCPRPALVGLASPGGFGSGRSALGAPLPVRLGSPLCFSPVFPPVFVSVLFLR